jgi:predicted dehydrogenase
MRERLVRAGVVGCGFQGRLHVESLQAIDDVEVVAICDTDPGRLDEIGDRFGVRERHDDYRALLDLDLDLLTICTMPNTHCEITLAAFDAGLHVLCEKPFAMNAAEALAMVEASRAANRLLAVGFNMRFAGSAREVRAFIERGELGTPICARGFMLSDDVPWWGKHYVRRISGGGALAATAVHMLDLVPWLAGSPLPTTATASMTTLFPGKRGAGAPSVEAARAYDTEDLFNGFVRFDTGFWMSIEGAWVWDKAGWNYSFDLVGSTGHAHFDPLNLVGERDGRAVDLTEGRPSDRDFPTSVAREIEDVVDAVRAGRPPAIAATGDEALVTQALVDTLYRSAEEGRELAVEIPKPAAAGART